MKTTETEESDGKYEIFKKRIYSTFDLRVHYLCVTNSEEELRKLHGRLKLFFEF